MMKIKVERAAPDPVLTGQRVTLNVTLMTPTLFASAPAFELPNVPGVLLMHVDEPPVLGTEQAGDDTYTTQLHQVALFCLKPGKHTIPAFAVRVASPPRFGPPAEEHRLTTEQFTIDATMPPGTENLPGIVCTKRLEVKQSWEPAPKKSARVGDSVTRRVTLVTPDVPAMAMPPVGMANVDGVKAYLRPPAVLDRNERGVFTGERTDAAVYVFDRAGRVEFPTIEIPWWDLANNKLARETLPGLSVDVAPPSMSIAAPSTETQSTSELVKKIIAGLVTVVLVVAVARWLLWHGDDARRAATTWWRRRQDSEVGRFEHLGKACRAGNAIATYTALNGWLESQRPDENVVTFERDLPGYATDAELRREVDALQEAALGRGNWNSATLWAALRNARRLTHELAAAGHNPLPPLNPVRAHS
jgi:hypothetical protein